VVDLELDSARASRMHICVTASWTHVALSLLYITLTHERTHTRTNSHTHTHTHAREHTCKHHLTGRYIYIYTCIYTCIYRLFMMWCLHVYTCYHDVVCSDIYMIYACIYIHTYIYTCMNVYVHTQVIHDVDYDASTSVNSSNAAKAIELPLHLEVRALGTHIMALSNPQSSPSHFCIPAPSISSPSRRFFCEYFCLYNTCCVHIL